MKYIRLILPSYYICIFLAQWRNNAEKSVKEIRKFHNLIPYIYLIFVILSMNFPIISLLITFHPLPVCTFPAHGRLYLPPF